MNTSKRISFPVAPGDTIWMLGCIPGKRTTTIPQMVKVKVTFVVATAEGKYFGVDTGAILRSDDLWFYTEEEAKISSKQINYMLEP